MNYSRLIDITRALKGKHQTGRVFITTFAFYKRKLLAIGNNSYEKTHPLTFGYKTSKVNNVNYEAKLHAEICCLIRLGLEDCSDITFINVRIDNNNQPNMARPCMNCFNILSKQVGYKKIIYTDQNGNFIELI